MLLGKFKISGHSMEPLFKNGSTILVSSLPYFFSQPKIGDVVAFQYKNKILIKRIKEIKSNEYFLRGDNTNDSLDSKTFGSIAKKQLIGKVILKL